MDLKYVPQVAAWHKALHALGIAVDIVSPEVDLSGYKVVIAPVLYMVKPGLSERLEAFTLAGGTFLTTYFSGLVDENDRVYLGGYPGPLRKLLGIWSEEIDALSPAESNEAVFEEPFGGLQGTYPAKLLCDLIHPEGARVLATYGREFYAGRPALTVNSFGAGRAYYLATMLDQSALTELAANLCDQQGVTSPLPGCPAPGLEVTERVSPTGVSLLYLLNHAQASVSQSLPYGTYRDLISGNIFHGHVELASRNVLILARED